LLELGGVSLACHSLWQLNTAGFATVIVVVGFQGEAVQRAMQAYAESEKDIFSGLCLKFVVLGKGWRGGRAASIAKAIPMLEKAVKADDSFVVMGYDHIFDAVLLEEAAAVDLSSDGDDACVLVEVDLEGMRGLPQSTVYCAMRPLHGADRIYSIGSDIETYSGIEAGLMVVVLSSIRRLVEMTEANATKATPVSAFLAEIARRGTLRMSKTNGRTWFSVETTESVEYTSEKLGSIGQVHKLADGREVNLVGLPKKTETSPADGGEWAEFSVEKWRSAVYTAKSFFLELFDDTTDFIGGLCDELGGNSKHGPLLVEVGCGTGEALIPLFSSTREGGSRARYVSGMDFNPHFVEFCKQNVPAEDKGHVNHFVGDAQVLDELLRQELPVEWEIEKRPKVVICVGNTIGIMPLDVRKNVYKQMRDLAGYDGYMVVVYWNGNKFGDATQNFYHKNPQLCGKFTGECINLDTCTLTTPSGYCTHWTKPEEARGIFEKEIGVEVTSLLEKGNGVLVAGRMRRPNSPK